MRFLFVFLLPVLLQANVFVLPTPNRAILTPGAEEQYFTPTPGRDWTSGTFGCVRTAGNQMHEGLDIKATKRDSKGEATDEIYAAAAGKVAYINSKTSLSNYGKYIVLEHKIEGLQVFTFYAHLSAIRSGLSEGTSVKQGEIIGTMGRTSNTRQAISKERAHLHFEINFRLNDRYAGWHRENLKGMRNDHGNWNGRNFVAIDPMRLFREQHRLGKNFSFSDYVRKREELCRVLVRDTSFPYLRNCTPLVRRNSLADKHGVAGYEIALDYNGLPFELIPRSSQEITSRAKIRVISVNSAEQKSNHCRKLLTLRKTGWDLSPKGLQLVQLLTY